MTKIDIQIQTSSSPLDSSHQTDNLIQQSPIHWRDLATDVGSVLADTLLATFCFCLLQTFLLPLRSRKGWTNWATRLSQKLNFLEGW